MDYFEILKKSFRIAWNNKYLWLFGLFAGGVGYNFPSFMNLNMGSYSNDDISQYIQSAGTGDQALVFFMLIFVILLLVFFIATVLRFVSEAALIFGVDQIQSRKKVGFKEVLIYGLNKFWKVLWQAVVIGIVSFVITLFFITPAIISFIYKAWIMGFLWSILAIICLLVWAVLVGLVYRIAIRNLVLNNQKVRPSIHNAMLWVRNNFGKCITMMVLLFIVNMILGLIIMIVMMVLILPILFSGLISYLAFKTTGLVIVGIIGGAVILFFMIVYHAVYGIFISGTWTLFYREIEKLEIKHNVNVKVRKTQIIKKVETKTSIRKIKIKPVPKKQQNKASSVKTINKKKPATSSIKKKSVKTRKVKPKTKIKSTKRTPAKKRKK